MREVDACILRRTGVYLKPRLRTTTCVRDGGAHADCIVSPSRSSKKCIQKCKQQKSTKPTKLVRVALGRSAPKVRRSSSRPLANLAIPVHVTVRVRHQHNSVHLLHHRAHASVRNTGTKSVSESVCSSSTLTQAGSVRGRKDKVFPHDASSFNRRQAPLRPSERPCLRRQRWHRDTPDVKR